MSSIEVLFLSAGDVDKVGLSARDVLDVVEMGLKAHGHGQTDLPSKSHINIDYPDKLYNVLPGYVAPIETAGVKLLGDFHGNYAHTLPSELSTLILTNPGTGAPYAILNSTAITWMRTGAVTAVGAKHLARKGSKVLAHIGARGTAWYNVEMLDLIFDFDEIRVTSARPQSRARFADIMSEKLGKKIKVFDNGPDTARDADIIIDASRLNQHEVLVPNDCIKPGALIQPYGAVLSVEPDLPTAFADKFVVDDWNQCKLSKWGQFAGLIQDGSLRDEHLYGEIGEIVAGLKPGRTDEEERICFWHKGFAISDLVVGHLLYTRAREMGIGTPLTYYEEPKDQ